MEVGLRGGKGFLRLSKGSVRGRETTLSSNWVWNTLLKSSSSTLNFSVVARTGSRLLKASNPGLAVVCKEAAGSRWRMKAIGSGSGWGMAAGTGRKSAVVVTLSLGLGDVLNV